MSEIDPEAERLAKLAGTRLRVIADHADAQAALLRRLAAEDVRALPWRVQAGHWLERRALVATFATGIAAALLVGILIGRASRPAGLPIATGGHTGMTEFVAMAPGARRVAL